MIHFSHDMWSIFKIAIGYYKYSDKANVETLISNECSEYIQLKNKYWQVKKNSNIVIFAFFYTYYLAIWVTYAIVNFQKIMATSMQWNMLRKKESDVCGIYSPNLDWKD